MSIERKRNRGPRVGVADRRRDKDERKRRPSVSILSKAAKFGSTGKGPGKSSAGLGGLLSSSLSALTGGGTSDLVGLATSFLSGSGKGRGLKSTQNLPAIISTAARVLPALTGRGGTGGLIRGAVGGAALGEGIDLIQGLLSGGGGSAGVACPSGFHPAKDGSGRCVRNRRMNPLNPRAFRRSVRRLKGARRFAREVEKIFPRPRRRAHAHAPAHHHHRRR